jgi:hypothetical protein
MHTNGRLIFERYALPYIRAGESVLEVGPARGNTIIRDALPTGCAYHYADVQNFHAGEGRVWMPDGYTLSADESAFGIVLSAQVVEHVAAPWRWVRELARVARRAVILIAPVSYEYHPGKGLDCWRIYADGLSALLAAAGLRVAFARHESLDGAHTDTIGIGEKP